MKNMLKLTVCLVLIMTFIITMASCKSDEASAEKVKEKVTNVYRTISVNLPDNVAPGSNFVYKNDILYMVCREINDGVGKSLLYSFSLDGEVIDTRVLGSGDSGNVTSYSDGNAYIESYNQFDDGRYLLLQSKFNTEIMSNEYIIEIYSQDDTLLNTIDVNSLIDPSFGNIYFSYMVVDSGNNIYLAGGGTYVAAFTENGGKILVEHVSQNENVYISDLGATSDGKVFVIYNDYSNPMSSLNMSYIDVSSKSFQPVTIPEKFTTYQYTVTLGPDYDLYVKDGIGFYGYNYDGDELTLLADWMNSDIVANRVNNITVLSPNKLIYMGYSDLLQKQQVNILSKVPDDEVKEKYVIRLSAMSETQSLYLAASEFNRNNDEYRVVIDVLSYNSAENYADLRAGFMESLVSGKMPDIVSVESDMLYKSLMDKGAFVDFYELIDKDPDWNRDMFFKSVMTPFEQNGKLYQMFTSFNVQTLAAKTKNIKDIADWNLETAIDYINNLPEGISFTEFDSMDMLSNVLLIRSLEGFIDYENATCDFDNENFKNILTILNRFGEMDYQVYNEMMVNGEITKKLTEDKAIFSSASIGSFRSYLETKVKFGMEDITYIGFPSPDGNGSVIQGTSFAISSKSPYIDGAWEFFKYLLRDEIQTSDMYAFMWPVTTSAFNIVAEREKSSLYMLDEMSGQLFKTYTGAAVVSDDVPGNVIVKQEDVDYLYEYLNSEFATFNYDMELMQIVFEELMPFVEGVKTVDETVKIIQSRGLVYMNEKY